MDDGGCRSISGRYEFVAICQSCPHASVRPVPVSYSFCRARYSSIHSKDTTKGTMLDVGQPVPFVAIPESDRSALWRYAEAATTTSLELHINTADIIFLDFAHWLHDSRNLPEAWLECQFTFLCELYLYIFSASTSILSFRICLLSYDQT